MYEYIKGLVAELNPAYAVIEAGGIGYFVNISLTSYSALRLEEQTQLFLHQVVREDAHLLFGFTTKIERELFRQLITVNGVGPNTARLILSSLTPQELTNAILSENLVRLKSVKGIGQKAAERIIVELRDKVLSFGVSGGSSNNIGDGITIGAKKELSNEAISALTMLGYSSQQAHKAVSSIIKAEPDLPVEQVIKKALKAL